MRAILIIAVILQAEAGFAQDPLMAAKDLYASAAYEEALSALGRVTVAASPDVARQADQYRAFCLYALGRTREAESVVESLIREKPLLRLDADASPRLEKMFSDVRQRLLPSLIRDRVRTARSALDQKSFSAAEPPLLEASLMIVEADKLGIKDEGLADLSVLVDGFLQLIRTAADQRVSAQLAATTPAAPAAAPIPSPPPPAPPTQSVPSRGLAALRAAAAPPATPASEPHLYSIEDKGVIAPVALEQAMPAMPADIRQLVKGTRATGIIDLVIDEAGRVVDATLRQSLNVGFDPVMLRSVRRWRYMPATKDGTPVRFLQTVAIVP